MKIYKPAPPRDIVSIQVFARSLGKPYVIMLEETNVDEVQDLIKDILYGHLEPPNRHKSNEYQSKLSIKQVEAMKPGYGALRTLHCRLSPSDVVAKLNKEIALHTLGMRKPQLMSEADKASFTAEKRILASTEPESLASVKNKASKARLNNLIK